MVKCTLKISSKIFTTAGQIKKFKSLIYFAFKRFKLGQYFILQLLQLVVIKKNQIPTQTTQSNLEFFMSRRDAYYHSYQNPLMVIGTLKNLKILLV